MPSGLLLSGKFDQQLSVLRLRALEVEDDIALRACEGAIGCNEPTARPRRHDHWERLDIDVRGTYVETKAAQCTQDNKIISMSTIVIAFTV